MAHVLVAGGTGNAGRHVVEKLVLQGCQVRVLSRGTAPGHPVHGVDYVRADVVTGQGLQAAFDDVDVLVDTLNGTIGPGLRPLTTGAQNLLDAARQAGVRHVVLLSIANVDQCSLGHYRAKAAQERIYRTSGLSATVVRATQFHGLVEGILSAGRLLHVIPVFRGASYQTIAAEDMAAELARIAAEPVRSDDGGAPFVRQVDMGGPEVLSMREMAEIHKERHGRGGRVTAVPTPFGYGPYIRTGLNLVPDNKVGTVRFSDWLEGQARQ